MSIIVTFSDNELAHLDATAASVSGRRGDRRPNPTFIDGKSTKGGYTQAEADYIAMKGEYAVAKLFGLPLEACDMTQLHVTKPNYDHDLILPDGRTAQIKAIKQRTFTTSYPFLFALETTDPNDIKADLGLLALLLPNKYQVRVPGWFTREQFVVWHEIKDLGTGKRAVLPISK